MKWDQLPALLGAFGVIVTGVTKFVGQSSRLRSRIRHDQETLEKLSSGGPTRALLVQHIDANIRQLIRLESDRARRSYDWAGIGLALAFLGIAIGLVVWTVRSEWSLILNVAAWLFVVVLILFGLVGLGASIKKPEVSESMEDAPSESADG